jgi:hypothetical protein
MASKFTYTISSQPYYSSLNQSYMNIITINSIPAGPLSKLVIRIKSNRLSPFTENTNCNNKCLLGFQSLNNCNNQPNLMTVDQIPELFSFLSANGYNIDTSLTKMMNLSDIKINNNTKLISFIHYTR